MVVTPSVASLQEQIISVLRKRFKNAAIEVRPAFEERIYIVLVSPTLDGTTEQEKQHLVWSALEDVLKTETRRISFITAYSFEELFNIPFRAKIPINKYSQECHKRKNLIAPLEAELRSSLERDSLIHIRLQADCHIGVRVVSPSLNGKSSIEKISVIKEASKHALQEHAELVSFVVAYGTDEL